MAAMTTDYPASAVNTSKARIWTGRILSALLALALTADGFFKVIKDPHVLAASAPLGFNPDVIMKIGAILLACVVLYVIPRTSVLGAMLITGYLGGAVCTQMRVGATLFNCIFPVILGILVWGALYLRDGRLWEFAPLRK